MLYVSTVGVKGLSKSLTSSCWKADHRVAVSPVTDVVLERQEVKQQLRNRRHSSQAETRVQVHTELLHHKYVHQSMEKSTVDRGRGGCNTVTKARFADTIWSLDFLLTYFLTQQSSPPTPQPRNWYLTGSQLLESCSKTCHMLWKSATSCVKALWSTKCFNIKQATALVLTNQLDNCLLRLKYHNPLKCSEMLTALRWKCRRYMESSDEECQQKYIQVGVNQQSFHLINVFTLKTYNNRYTHIKLLAAECLSYQPLTAAHYYYYYYYLLLVF